MSVLAGQTPFPGDNFEKMPPVRMVGPQGEMPHHPWERLFECLDLSDAQQKEIGKRFQASRERAEKLHAEMREAGRRLRQALEPGKFDEKVVRKLAAEKARLETDLMVGKARTHHEIYELLTPEQKELVDLAGKLQRLRGAGMPHPGAHMGPPVPRGAKSARGGE